MNDWQVLGLLMLLSKPVTIRRYKIPWKLKHEYIFDDGLADKILERIDLGPWGYDGKGETHKEKVVEIADACAAVLGDMMTVCDGDMVTVCK